MNDCMNMMNKSTTIWQIIKSWLTLQVKLSLNKVRQKMKKILFKRCLIKNKNENLKYKM